MSKHRFWPNSVFASFYVINTDGLHFQAALVVMTLAVVTVTTIVVMAAAQAAAVATGVDLVETLVVAIGDQVEDPAEAISMTIMMVSVP